MGEVIDHPRAARHPLPQRYVSIDDLPDRVVSIASRQPPYKPRAPFEPETTAEFLLVALIDALANGSEKKRSKLTRRIHRALDDMRPALRGDRQRRFALFVADDLRWSRPMIEPSPNPAD